MDCIAIVDPGAPVVIRLHTTVSHDAPGHSDQDTVGPLRLAQSIATLTRRIAREDPNTLYR